MESVPRNLLIIGEEAPLNMLFLEAASHFSGARVVRPKFTDCSCTSRKNGQAMCRQVSSDCPSSSVSTVSPSRGGDDDATRQRWSQPRFFQGRFSEGAPRLARPVVQIAQVQ